MAIGRDTYSGELVELLDLNPSAGAQPSDHTGSDAAGRVLADCPWFPALVPEIPGFLRASLASRARAGIALRVDVDSGAVRDLTVATAFSPPLLPVTEISARVTRWVDTIGGDPTAHRASPRCCYQATPAKRFRGVGCTATVSPRGQHATIYMRPAWPTGPA